MPTKKGKLPPARTDSMLVMRFVDVSQPTRAVIATENIVQRYDDRIGDVVNEVLLMSGVEFRGGKDQVPIVDSHDDTTVRNIFGSIQKMRIDHATGELIGVPVFASDEESQVIRQRMDEGHITDFSITGDPLETLFVPRGERFVTERGQEVPGPALIHKRWTPLNASICATGADVASTVRRSYTDLKRIKRMDEILLGQLKEMGLPEGITDANQALSWVLGKLSTTATPPVENMEEPPAEEEKPVVENMDAPAEEEKPLIENMEDEEKKVELSRSKAEALIRRALDGDKVRRKEIQAACKLARIERAFADQLCDDGISVDDARKRILERMATQETGSSVGAEIRHTESAEDKFYAAAHDGLIQRAKSRTGVKRSLYLSGEQAAQGADDFSKLDLNRLAAKIIARQGFPVDRMSKPEIAQAAIGNPRVARKYRVERSEGAYHSRGSFPNLMLDASNKTLLAAYEEAAFTWSMWARQAPSVDDFKTINRIRFSESGNPEHVPENQPYPERVMSDSKESYFVEKYGALFTVTWETIVNDDLDALSRIPAMHGNAMRRLQNRKVYEVLTANPTMGDGVALFGAHSSGSNTSGAAAAPSETTLNAGFLAMALQKGLNSDAVLNIVPRFLVVPVNYAATALQLTNSTAPPTVGGSAVGTSGTFNIYGPGGQRPLTVIAEPTLDAASSTDWYLAADPATIDTVELAFLSGEESPVLEDEWVMERDVWQYKIRQTFGVKAIDWRGLFRNKA